jgi:phosphoribosylanthranilate isomerase
MRTRIKICGVRDVTTALAAAEAGADAVGLVFVERSPRFVSVEQARAVAAALPAFVEPVALFVDAPLEIVRPLAAAIGVHTIQLHGSEGAEYVRQLSGFRVIKAMAFDVAAIAKWSLVDAPSNVAGLLIDAPAEASAAAQGLTGGGGKAFDWSALAALERTKLPPLILAGGLTPANVGDAIRAAQPYAVDVSSGVESSRGVKNVQWIRQFCEAVRQADQRST